MHCILLAILSQCPSPAVGTNWPFCVYVPLKHQSINQSINLACCQAAQPCVTHDVSGHWSLINVVNIGLPDHFILKRITFGHSCLLFVDSGCYLHETFITFGHSCLLFVDSGCYLHFITFGHCCLLFVLMGTICISSRLATVVSYLSLVGAICMKLSSRLATVVSYLSIVGAICISSRLATVVSYLSIVGWCIWLGIGEGANVIISKQVIWLDSNCLKVSSRLATADSYLLIVGAICMKLLSSLAAVVSYLTFVVITLRRLQNETLIQLENCITVILFCEEISMLK